VVHVSDESLAVERADRDDCVVLVVRGDLDLPTEGQLLAAVSAVLREQVGRPVVLDLSRLRFLASMGDSELIMIRHEATSSARRCAWSPAETDDFVAWSSCSDRFRSMTRSLTHV
jgi:anti-anti-sigma factor